LKISGSDQNFLQT